MRIDEFGAHDSTPEQDEAMDARLRTKAPKER